ncbi:hypothetical protein D3C71_2244360 [compost metagenome]
MKCDSSEARNSTRLATSSGMHMRAMGLSAMPRATGSRLGTRAWVMGVQMPSGWIELQRMR